LFPPAARIKETCKLLSLAGTLILFGFYCHVTFTALIMMFPRTDGEADHHYANGEESDDLDFLSHDKVEGLIVG
jgi:hypothetical protein